MLVQFEHGGIPVSLEGFDGDHITRVIKRTHDFFEAEILKSVGDLDPTGAIVDVGAFIGNHSVYFGLFTDASEVIAIEPNPVALPLLETNIDLNGLSSKVQMINCAVGAEEGIVGMREGRRFNRGRTVVVEGSDTKLRTLDDIVGDTEVSVLKVDVEGYEAKVFKGASELLSQQAPVVYAEARTKKRKRILDESLGIFGYKHVVTFNHRSWEHSYKK